MSDKLRRMLTNVKDKASSIKYDCDSILSGTKLEEYDEVSELEMYVQSIINCAEEAKAIVMQMYDEID